uniref:Voltage-dependent T-type calcium channel subunit alpha-1H n=1 Tax=Esox lucius TaxID=8010 RepID=A0A6Q2YMN1_ESOLU
MTDGDGRVRFHYAPPLTPSLTVTPQEELQKGDERQRYDGEVRFPGPTFHQGHATHPSLCRQDHNPSSRPHAGFPVDEDGVAEEGGSNTWSPRPEGGGAGGAPGVPGAGPGGGGVSGNMRGDTVTDPGDLVSEEEEQQPYPSLEPVVFFCAKQTTRPRSWCLRMVCNPYPLHPCEDVTCQTEWCLILQVFDDCIFAFFAVEMVIKMVALGVFGSKCYLGDTWNRLDFFIVMAGMMEYSLDGHNASLSAIRTVRVLRPLRAINRVPSMRILVTLLLDTLPMLGNVLLLCFFVFFIFGIVGVQLWAGLLRNRCFMGEDFRTLYNLSLSAYYQPEEGEDDPFICSAIRENGMLRCHDVPPFSKGQVECSLAAPPPGQFLLTGEDRTGVGCVNWNQYYNVCRPGNVNPHKGSVNFDNIAYAWIAIFQVITLEGWVDIMYYVMDAHSFYNFIYFILLIIVGSFFMINLCLVVIATQFAETKQRENALMREQRARYMSNDSTLASYSEPGSCYEEMLRYISHLYRKLTRRVQPREPLVNPGVSPLGRLNGGMNYPTILPSLIRSSTQTHPHRPHHTSSSVLSPLPPSPLRKLHHLMGQQSRPRLLDQLADLVPSALLLELLTCPLCANALGKLQLDMGGPESSRGEADTLHNFPQGEEGRGGRGRRRGRCGSGLALALKRCQDRLAEMWGGFGDRLRRIVDSKYFNRGIMIAILINTLSMGIEYHQQPEELTDILEISNIVFTSMFVLEMMFKLLAFGMFGYIKNPYNIFDGIIVIISVWEVIGQADGGLSVLRTFRLLRVLKLVRFMPALRRQLVVLMKTMDNVATFCMLLMLFIFTFSILGMHLFGCKFSLQTENGDTIPDRKNFDSLLWATVTVFQILTQEDWNVVLYNGMASTTPLAALYFVALMTFGNYVLFNLLVAILVEGFQAEGDANRSDSDDEKRSDNFEEEEKIGELRDTELKMYSLMMTANGHVDRNSLAPPIIMRTAATPMPTPKSSLEAGIGCMDSRRGSNASIDPSVFDRSIPCWGSVSGWGSRRSSWNSLSRAPSLKRRDTSGERESLLSGEGGGEEEEEAEAAGGGRSRLYPRPGSLELVNKCQPEVFVSVCDDVLCPLQNPWVRLKKVLESRQPLWCREHEELTLYLFSPQNSFRIWCKGMISHKLFDHVVLVFIFLNCITIALERPNIQLHSIERVFLSVSNYVFTVIFLAEMTVKVVALGFCLGQQSYLKSSWNVLDGILVLVSLVDILVSLASTGGNRILGILRVLRLLRTLRPLRVISRAPGLKLVVETLITSLRPIGNIVLICCAFFIVFGILGVQLFKGKFYVCEGPDTKNITNRSDCLLANYQWRRRKYNFDNLGQALMSLFVLSCKDGWVNIMYDGLDAVGVDQQPMRNHNPWMLLYFISFLLIVSFFVLNMFVGVVVENFHKCRQDQEEEEQRLREEKRLKILEKKRRSKEKDGAEAQRRPYYADYSPIRLSIHTLCTSNYLDLFITIIIGINVVTMSMEHYDQPQYLEDTLKYFNYVFTCIFIIEALLKLMAFGLHRFFKDRWNQLDVAIVLLSIMGITLEELKMNASLPINPTIIRIMRVLRIARVLKLLKMAKGMRALLDTVMQALPQVGNLGLLFMLLFFIYAALGVELFGKLECNDSNPCEGLNRHATFENFGMAFLTLFRISTGDNWNGIMKDTLRECRPEDRSCLTYLPLVSPLYFVTFVLMAQFVLVNVVVAVLMKHLEESNKEAKEEAEMDAEIELEMERARRLSSASNASSLVTAYKMSVSRMHSLPNDSYMFRPVRPASAPYTLQEEHTSPLGSVTSVRSQPCENRSLLQVPSLSPPPSSGSTLPRIAPPRPSPSPRAMRRQCLHTRDSLEKQDPLSVPPPQPLALLPSHPSSPPTNSDPADEEVCHITCSARHWWEGHGRSALNLRVAGLKGQDSGKVFGVDSQCSLDKPCFPDDLRRHSVEIFLPPPGDPLLEYVGEVTGGGRRPGGQGSEGKVHRKKKMSPPCISIHPPCEPPGHALSEPTVECSTMLRRRTPSSELTDTHTPSHTHALEPSDVAVTFRCPPVNSCFVKWKQCRAEHCPSLVHFTDSTSVELKMNLHLSPLTMCAALCWGGEGIYFSMVRMWREEH